MLSEPQDQKEPILIEMNYRKRKLCFLLLGMMVFLKITLTIFPLLPEKGSLTTSLHQAEAAGGSDSTEVQANDEKGEPPKKEEDTTGNARDPSLWMEVWLDVMKKKEMEIEKRDETLRLEEERLKALRNDIVEKLTQLQQAEERFVAFIEEKTKLVDQKEKKGIKEEERIKQLAKIFESTPPEQAGNLLGRLETRIAARILLQMNGRKAGKIWGFVKLDQAVKISQELSKMK